MEGCRNLQLLCVTSYLMGYLPTRELHKRGHQHKHGNYLDDYRKAHHDKHTTVVSHATHTVN